MRERYARAFDVPLAQVMALPAADVARLLAAADEQATIYRELGFADDGDEAAA